MNKCMKHITLLIALILILAPTAYGKSKTTIHKATPKRIVSANTPIDTSINENNLGGTAINEKGQNIATKATFLAQLAVQGTPKSGGNYPTDPAVDIQGRINVAPADIGQSGEVFIVAVYEGAWYMRTEVLTGPPGQQPPQDSWVPWNQQIPQLQSTGKAQSLTATIDFDIATNLASPGDFLVYLGYRSAGILHYSPQPFSFNGSMWIVVGNLEGEAAILSAVTDAENLLVIMPEFTRKIRHG